MTDPVTQPTWDFVFPEGGGFDFEELPVPIINCLDDGTYEQIEQAIAVIKLRTGATQATAWVALFEQILHIRQFLCSQEKKDVNEFDTVVDNLSRDRIIDLPANCIGLRLTFLGNPTNFEIRTPLTEGLPGKFNFGGVSFLYFGGYTNEIIIERTNSFIACPKGSNKALIYLIPRVNMQVVAIIEK